MNTNWNVAASAGVWGYNPVQKTDTTGAIAQNKKEDAWLKPQNAETTGAVAFEYGTYSSCQSGSFEAAA